MIGLQVLRRKRIVAADLVEKFATVPVANVSDVMARMTAGGSRLRPVHDGTPLIVLQSRSGRGPEITSLSTRRLI
jgi:hypothetical protein